MTAGSGVRSPRNGSSAEPSPPTGPQTESASSDGSANGSRPDAEPAAESASSDGSANGSRPDAEPARAKRRPPRTGRKLFRFDRKQGYRFVAGADEAGRGCLAGPLVAAAVLFD